MPIVDDVSARLKDAMRAKDKPRTTALRNIRAALLARMKEDNSDTLPDAESEKVLRRLEKQRKESIDAYEQAGRDDLVDSERAELAVIQQFLPKLADEQTTRTWVQQAVAQTGASEPGHIGKVMGVVMSKHRGEVDGGLAKRLAAEILGG